MTNKLGSSNPNRIPKKLSVNDIERYKKDLQYHKDGIENILNKIGIKTPAYEYVRELKNDFHIIKYDFIEYKISNKQKIHPRCPNTKCDNHNNPPPAKFGFIISIVEEGFLGKIFKSEAYGIVSCKKCGEVIGVGGKG